MKWLPAILLLAMLALLPACEDDPVGACLDCGGFPQEVFQPLASRSAVLNNLALAWNKRNVEKIDELLDADFIFYFSSSDVGGEIPASWDRNTEMATTEALFTSNTAPIPTGPVCRQLSVDLVYDGLTWVEVPGPAAAIGEVWYSTTVIYTFTFQMEGDLTYIQNNAKAEFVVRQLGDEWRLVEWHDLGATIVTRNATVSSETKNWGAIKSLYK